MQQLKSNWNTSSLQDLCCTLQSGGTPARSDSHNFGGPYKWASVADLTKSGKFVVNTAGSLSAKGLNESTAVLFPANTILFAMYASIGECAIASDNMACSQAILGIQPNERCNTEFLYYFLQSYKQKAKSLGQQGTQSNLNKKIVGDILVSVPPLVEQHKIASVLSDIDALIEAQEALIAKKKDVKAATMELLLTGTKKLPGFNDITWTNTVLSKCLTFEGGSQPDKSNFKYEKLDGYVRLIQIRDYKSDKFITYIPIELARRFCLRSDILIGRYGPPVFQILDGIEGSYNVALIKATPSSQVNRDFMFYFLKQQRLLSFIENLSKRSSGQTGVDLSSLKNYPIAVPPLNEQKAISEVIKNLYVEIELLEIELAKQKNAKSAAMHKLLTGEIRLT